MYFKALGSWLIKVAQVKIPGQLRLGEYLTRIF